MADTQIISGITLRSGHTLFVGKNCMGMHDWLAERTVEQIKAQPKHFGMLVTYTDGSADEILMPAIERIHYAPSR